MTSDGDDVDVLRVCRQGVEIVGICRDHGSTGFSRSDDQRIDGGAPASTSSEKRGTTSERFGDRRRDVAGLEEPVLDGVATRVTLKTLDEHDRRNERWPQSRLTQGKD